MLPNIKPIINRAIVSFILAATVITTIKTNRLPKLEATASATSLKIENVKNPENKEEPIIKNAAPKLAPELMPRTNGPASGFLNNVCISSPLSERPAPTNSAVMAFGKR